LALVLSTRSLSQCWNFWQIFIRCRLSSFTLSLLKLFSIFSESTFYFFEILFSAFSVICSLLLFKLSFTYPSDTGGTMLDSWTQNFLSPQPSQSAAPLITIQQLNHSFGKGMLKKQILCDVNLTVHSGEIVIVTGSSGAGKTTLLTLIGALQSVQAGSLNIFGQELKDASATTRTLIRRNIGFVFQEHNLLPFMTTLQNVQTALKLKAYPNRHVVHHRAEAVLTKVGLRGYLNTYPENLSRGQKQRVAIARALANEPPLILADEPTASLDSQIGREVVLMMQRLAKEQRCAILLVTHDDRILDIADRVIRLEDGRLIQDDVAGVPTAFTALSQMVSDQAILDLATRDQAILPDAAIPDAITPDATTPDTAAPATPDAPPIDIQAAENFILHPLVSDTTPLFFSKLSQNASTETTGYRAPQPPVQEQPSVPIAQPPAQEQPSVPIAQPPVQEQPSVPIAQPPVHVTSQPATSDNPTPVAAQSHTIAPSSIPNLSLALPSLSQQTASKTYTIACIDDSPAILYTMQSFLEDELFSVVLIQDPEQALAEVLKYHPDVIVLDVVMPKLDGYALCSLIRQNKQLSHIPIIFITEDTKAFNSKRAKELGVTVHLKKPFNQADLIVRIFPHLN
jgi:putative ABC transport system ATP-binding protein